MSFLQSDSFDPSVWTFKTGFLQSPISNVTHHSFHPFNFKANISHPPKTAIFVKVDPPYEGMGGIQIM